MCKPTPKNVQIEQIATFAAAALAGRPRVLELGCDLAGVAGKLASLGFEVARALDARPNEPIAGVTYASLSELQAAQFDAIVVGAALRTSDAIGVLLDHLGLLLAPRGRLIVDEMDIGSVDADAVRWFTELAATKPGATPATWSVASWRAAFEPGAKNDGEAMRHAIEQRFVVRARKRGEYLYRFLGASLSDDPAHLQWLEAARVKERLAIMQGEVLPAGLQIVAEREPLKCGVAMSDGVQCMLVPGHNGLHRWWSPEGRTFDWG